jgi:hypothetical protein
MPPTPEDNRRYTEQTWFAAATGTLNGLLLNGMKSIPEPGAVYAVKLLSLLISLYAAFLVLQRSADAAGEFEKTENQIDEVSGETREGRKWRETRRNLRVAWRHLPFVLHEASGALFYLLLIGVSCLAVWLASPASYGP